MAKVRDWGGTKKEFIDNIEEKEESDDEPKHSYDFDWEWDHNNEKIILKAKDKTTKRKWRLELGKEDGYIDPSTTYDEMNEIFDDDDYEIIFKYDWHDGMLTVQFKLPKKKVPKYSFDLEQIEGKKGGKK